MHISAFLTPSLFNKALHSTSRWYSRSTCWAGEVLFFINYHWEQMVRCGQMVDRPEARSGNSTCHHRCGSHKGCVYLTD